MNKINDPQVQKVVELYAYFGSPASIFKQLNKEYGENCLTAHAIRKIRETHRVEILAKRKELEATIPLLDVNERWARLQEIVDGALAGDEVNTKFGSYTKYDRLAALNALKLADAFTQTKGVVNTDDDEMVKSIVMDAFEALKLERPEATDDELIKEIEENLGDKVKPYLNQLRDTTLYVQ